MRIHVELVPQFYMGQEDALLVAMDEANGSNGTA
jgi:hypothetical protein